MTSHPRNARRLVPLALIGLLVSGCSSSNKPIELDDALGRSAATAPSTSAHDGTPWPAPTDVEQRAEAAGLSLGPMGTAQHYHPQLRIIVEGREMPVAANIGVDPVTGAMTALHTHEGDGTLHVEAHDAADTFTLGQLFIQWGVPLSRTQIGGIASDSITVTSNGQRVSSDPNDLILEPDQVIVVRVP